MNLAIRLTVVLGFLVFCIAAQADPTLVLDASGHWIGATGITINGSVFDVSFESGTCDAVFGLCDPAHFAFTDSASAQAADFAINSMAVQGNFVKSPQLIAQCDTTVINCLLVTSYGVTANGVATWFTSFHPRGAPDVENIAMSPLLSPQPGSEGAWAVWKSVPEPSTVTSLSLGLLALLAWTTFHKF